MSDDGDDDGDDAGDDDDDDYGYDHNDILTIEKEKST